MAMKLYETFKVPSLEWEGFLGGVEDSTPLNLERAFSVTDFGMGTTTFLCCRLEFKIFVLEEIMGGALFAQESSSSSSTSASSGDRGLELEREWGEYRMEISDKSGIDFRLLDEAETETTDIAAESG